MRLNKTLPAVIVAAFALTFMPTSSQAKSTAPSKKGAATSETAEGYAYDFSDDPLSGNSAAANAAVIRVRRAAARRTLIRPRLNFIPELFKSVENI